MRESIIQTTINKSLTWLAKKSVTALYKRTHFWTFSWGLDENTDLYLMSEESYHDYHRFGVREEKYADTPQTDCEACELDGKADVCKICRVSNYEPQTDYPWK